MGLANELIPSLEKGAWSTSKAPTPLGGAGTHRQRGTHFGTHHPASFGIRMDHRESSTAAEKHKAPDVGASCGVVVGDIGLELLQESSGIVQPAAACGAESGAVGSPPAFWLNLGLGREWGALSEATRTAVSELPLAALRELAALTVAQPRRNIDFAANAIAPEQ